MSRANGDRCPVRASPVGEYLLGKLSVASMECYMDNAIVKDHQHEFAVVWQALQTICQNIPPGELLRLEAQRASDTLLLLMQAAGCFSLHDEVANAQPVVSGAAAA